MSGVQHITVGDEDGDQRLDRWLRRIFPQVSQGQIEKMCRKGDLRVDKGRVKANTRLDVGQVVRIPPLPDAPAPQYTRQVSRADAEMIQSCVIYRDADVIVLNKPSGLAVQGGSGQARHVDGLASALMYERDEPPRLVHRLDKDTSGVLVLARTRPAAAALTASFRHRETRKIYWAAVAGSPLPRKGTIKFGLVKAGGRGAAGEGEKMHCVHPRAIAETEGAKRAHTDYAVLETAGGRMSWAALVPITGRTHQLRAHMAEIGHPILGDGKYGGSGQENLGDGWGAGIGGDVSRGLHLHARSLVIEHPTSKAQLSLTAPLSSHMQDTWDLMGWSPADVPNDPFYGDDDG
ncbi:pseudouridine synthase [Thalassobacter stenotrophicus]|jgi:23S rRNA pseudouridine955/2504/2580 synthase|uniref:Pseudouridine synthase n=2 Tax=Thalassobacter stenotrophicus TaxID=266809 RepID=A0A0P1EX39_9RHOB|nr:MULTISPECIES: RluA family pseudouridine synthase [Thalassobacter]KGK78345.1 pseudouridine synthase [Thalassobacter stenotrophicus]KGL00110.1 pseudouridine synthase [Thalassobacter sp. 16PALIMAR09]PVZ50226.1 RluA family pseudouridine synthase [Thalassobacter stenotrophicus]CUH59344.1 Ribosomal large subunit pseudouridine synthase C [Thalassobacter stenotrophicus]SHI99066.1 ribosomal large subunit pseudouridine synthase C [Thalassobacter stenotrophicus DSM 16310]